MTNKEKFDLNEECLSAQDRPVIKPPKCDLDKYRKHIKDFDISEEEQAELLLTLWHIMAAFVDLGFGLDSIQLLPSLTEKQNLQNAQDAVGQDGLDNSNGVRHDDE